MISVGIMNLKQGILGVSAEKRVKMSKTYIKILHGV